MNDTNIISGPKLKNPIERTSLGQLFFKNGTHYKDRICQIDGTENKSETFSSVKLKSTRLAIAMKKRGITSNDVISLCCSNTLDNTIPILATFYLGAKITNLEGSLSVNHTKHLLSLVTPKLIFVEDVSVNLIEDSLQGLPFNPEIIVIGDSSKYTTFFELTKKQENEEEFTPVEADPDDIVLMIFSSGTTGLPKAICHSHYTLLSMAQQLYESGTARPTLHFSSFYWITANLILISSFKFGHYRVFCRNPSAEDIFRIIERYKVEYMLTAPVLTYSLTQFENPEKYDTSSLKLLICVGTAMAPSQLQKLNDLFKNAFTTLGYALTEGGVGSIFNLENDQELARSKVAVTPCGKVAPGTQLKICDLDTDKSLGTNQKGEIRIQSPSLMKGYHKIDSSDVYDKDRFLKTGDVGYFDGDACLFVIGRIKEMFKYQSWHVVPSLVETSLLEHPNIKEAVVFGLPCGKDGEVPAACVVLKDGCHLSEDEIDLFLKEKVSDRERLRGGVTFMQNLPRTPTGKIIRKEVKEFVIKSKKS